MDYSLIQSIWTIVVLVLFVGIVVWAWSGKRKKHFDEAANLPFTEDDMTSVDRSTEEKNHG